MKRALFYLLLVFHLPGCGVLLPYMYDAEALQDRLTVSMPKEQVLKRLGKPDRVVQDDPQQTIWEYRLYPRGEWAAYLIHCPFFPNCYFPAEAGHAYYVVLQHSEVCMWGTPEVVRPLLGIVCGSDEKSAAKTALGRGPRLSVVPVFMPPPIAPRPQRLAVVPISSIADNEVNSWLDLTLNFLRTRHPDLILVEREDLRTVVQEVAMQYGGRVDDETTIRAGRLVGADSLLLYRLIVPEEDPRSASFELRLLMVENGTTVFRQMVSAHQAYSGGTAMRPVGYNGFDASVRRRALKEAAAYGLAALIAAFGDNPLGIVCDYGWSGDGLRVIDVLQGGPATRAGLKPGDQIISSNGQFLGGWADEVSLPAQLSVRRDGGLIDLPVR
ncbi:MAG TPA: PDZ domain-containing protein [Nitrospira sp.]|nr:PDZ domain-containing protein [Nitrospira sp.]